MVTNIKVNTSPCPANQVFRGTSSPIIQRAFQLMQIMTMCPRLVSIRAIRSIIHPRPRRSFFVLWNAVGHIIQRSLFINVITRVGIIQPTKPKRRRQGHTRWGSGRYSRTLQIFFLWDAGMGRFYGALGVRMRVQFVNNDGLTSWVIRYNGHEKLSMQSIPPYPSKHKTK